VPHSIFATRLLTVEIFFGKSDSNPRACSQQYETHCSRSISLLQSVAARAATTDCNNEMDREQWVSYCCEQARGFESDFPKKFSTVNYSKTAHRTEKRFAPVNSANFFL